MASSRHTRRDFLCLLGAAAGGTFTLDGEAQDFSALSVIVHPGNREPFQDLNALEAVFTTTQLYWPLGGRIVAFNLPPRSPPRVLFDRAILGMDPDEVSRFWVDRRVRGGAPPPRQVPEAGVLVRIVARLEGAVGYVPDALVDGSVRVIARVRGEKIVRP